MVRPDLVSQTESQTSQSNGTTGLYDLLRMTLDSGSRLLFFGDCHLCPTEAEKRELSTAHLWAAVAGDDAHTFRFPRHQAVQSGRHRLGAVLGRAVRNGLLLLPMHRPLQTYLGLRTNDLFCLPFRFAAQFQLMQLQ